MDPKDLKIVSKKELKKAREEFGNLLCAIEYLAENPGTERFDLGRIMKLSIEFRDTLKGL